MLTTWDRSEREASQSTPRGTVRVPLPGPCPYSPRRDQPTSGGVVCVGMLTDPHCAVFPGRGTRQPATQVSQTSGLEGYGELGLRGTQLVQYCCRTGRLHNAPSRTSTGAACKRAHKYHGHHLVTRV
eukprot:4913503-Amphidinium_carterae.1